MRTKASIQLPVGVVLAEGTVVYINRAHHKATVGAMISAVGAAERTTITVEFELDIDIEAVLSSGGVTVGIRDRSPYPGMPGTPEQSDSRV